MCGVPRKAGGRGVLGPQAAAACRARQAGAACWVRRGGGVPRKEAGPACRIRRRDGTSPAAEPRARADGQANERAKVTTWTPIPRT